MSPGARRKTSVSEGPVSIEAVAQAEDQIPRVVELDVGQQRMGVLGLPPPLVVVFRPGLPVAMVAAPRMPQPHAGHLAHAAPVELRGVDVGPQVRPVLSAASAVDHAVVDPAVAHHEAEGPRVALPELLLRAVVEAVEQGLVGQGEAVDLSVVEVHHEEFGAVLGDVDVAQARLGDVVAAAVIRLIVVRRVVAVAAGVGYRRAARSPRRR